MVTTILSQTVARLLLIPIYVTGVAILIKGSNDVGDGFSAGVVAASGVLLQYVTFGYRDAERLLPLRFASVGAFSGLALVLILAFVPVLFGKPLLSSAPAAGQEIITFGTLVLTSSFVFDVGVFLLVFGFVVAVISAIARSGEAQAL